MHIESIALEAFGEVRDGYYYPGPAIDGFALSADPHTTHTESFYVVLRIAYDEAEVGTMLRAEIRITDETDRQCGSINHPLGTPEARPGKARLVLVDRVPMQMVHFEIAGTHTMRVSLRDMSTPDGGILDRQYHSFPVVAP